MNAKTILLVLLFAAVIPGGTQAASVDRFFFSGAGTNTYFYQSDSCSVTYFYIEASEALVKNNGPATPVPTPFTFYIALDNWCVGESHYWLFWPNPNPTPSIMFSHTPATYGSFPKTVSVSANFDVLELYSGEIRPIHLELNFVSVGRVMEQVNKGYIEWPATTTSPRVRVDSDSNGHQSLAIGSLNITGGFQYTNPSLTGNIGVSIGHNLTITH